MRHVHLAEVPEVMIAHKKGSSLVHERQVQTLPTVKGLIVFLREE